MDTKFPLLLLFLAMATLCRGQEFTQQDSLRGSITPERSWWDLNYYHLDIKVDPDHKYISGSNTIRYKVLGRKTVASNRSATPLKNR